MKTLIIQVLVINIKATIDMGYTSVWWCSFCLMNFWLMVFFNEFYLAFLQVLQKSKICGCMLLNRQDPSKIQCLRLLNSHAGFKTSKEVALPVKIHTSHRLVNLVDEMFYGNCLCPDLLSLIIQRNYNGLWLSFKIRAAVIVVVL